MQARRFQYLSGLTVLITHIVAVALVATAARFSELTDQIGSILIIIPITLVYASAFMRYVVANSAVNAAQGAEQLDFLAVVAMYLVILTFCASLLYVVIKFVYFSSYKPNEFKMWLGAAESAFGALIAIVFERLFSTGSGRAIATTDRAKRAPGASESHPIPPP